MKLASTISQYLLGLMFTVFGSNGFLHFIKPPPPSSPSGVQFMTAVSESHFMTLIFLVQLIAGILLLAGRFVPLALVVLAAVLTNILNYHLSMDPSGIAPGLIATVLLFATAFAYRSSFRNLFAMKTEPQAAPVSRSGVIAGAVADARR